MPELHPRMTETKRRDWMDLFLLTVEVLFVLTALFGVWQIYWPAALILGGVLGVVALERIQAQHRAARTRVEPRRLERVA
jgi:hypothetical protein